LALCIHAKACPKYNKEEAKQDRGRSPNSEMSPYIQSTYEKKDQAQYDTNRGVSLGHKAEFSTPKAMRQSVVLPFRVAQHEAKASHYIDTQVKEHRQNRV